MSREVGPTFSPEVGNEGTGYVDAIVGLQAGDEGKGRIVDMFAEDEKYQYVARFNGGPNAGHTTVSPDGRTLKLHTVPSGIPYSNKRCVIGDGVFVDPTKLWDEIEYLRGEGVAVSPDNLKISSSAHLILPHHILEDIGRESGAGRQGSTRSGIAQVAGDLGLRVGARAELIKNDTEHLWDRAYIGLINSGSLWTAVKHRIGLRNRNEEDAAEKYVQDALKLAPFITDTMLYLDDALDHGKNILAEGAQGFQLDQYQGEYPYGTSSITTSGGISPGLGLRPQSIHRVIGVAKALHSRVGDGPLVTEITDPELLERLHGDVNAPDAERGTTTGRTRRLGHLDLAEIRRANKPNGTTEMALTKLDWVSRYPGDIPICVENTRKGKTHTVSSNAAYKLEQSKPEYEYLPNWGPDAGIEDTREFSDLPGEAQDYIKFIEEQTGVPITIIGVGQRRDQVIIRPA